MKNGRAEWFVYGNMGKDTAVKLVKEAEDITALG
jgi:hypothetical protein